MKGITLAQVRKFLLDSPDNREKVLDVFEKRELNAELGRRNVVARKTHGGPPERLGECPRCHKVLNATNMRKACPDHGQSKQ